MPGDAGWPTVVTAGVGRMLARYGADLAVESTYLCQVRQDTMVQCVDHTGASVILPLDLHSLFDRILERGALVLINDLAADSVLAEAGGEPLQGSFLGVGAFNEVGSLMGMLLAHGQSPREWTNLDLERASDVAQGVAAFLEIDNLRHHAMQRLGVEVHARGMRAQMYNISAQSAYAASLPELSRILVQATPDLLHADWTLIGVRHAESDWRVYVDPAHEDRFAPVFGGDDSLGDALLDDITEFAGRQDVTTDTVPSWSEVSDAVSGASSRVVGAPLSGSDELAMVMLCGFLRADPDMHTELLFDEMLEDVRRVVERTAAAQRQIQAASALQRSLLPPRLPDLDGFEIGRLYNSAADHTRVGGDWYDIVQIDAATTGFVVGDVAGHDIRSAALMGQVRHVLASQLRDRRRPAGALIATDRYFADLDEKVMATAVVIVVDQSTNIAHFALAGHPPPVLLSGGTASLIEAVPGPPVGFGFGGYLDVTQPLESGDTLVAYTDGVVETRTGDLAELLADFVKELDGADRSVPELIRLLDARSGSGELVDDVAALVLRLG